MARLEYTAEGYPFYADDGDSDSAPGDGTQLERVLPTIAPDDDAFTAAARRLYRGVFSPAREDRGGRALDLLAGGNPEVERYQTWPEKMIRSAVTLPYDAMMGRVPDTEAVMESNALATFLGADPKSTWSVPAHESMIGRVQDLAGLAISGPLTAPRGGATLRSGLERPDIGGGTVKAPTVAEATAHAKESVAATGERWESYTPEQQQEWLRRSYDQIVRSRELAAPTAEMKPHPDNPTLSVRGFEEALKLGREYNERAKELGGIPLHQLERDPQIQEISQRLEANQQQSAQDIAAWTAADAARRAQHAPVFYSAVEYAVSNARQQSATPDQWLGFLRNQPGVKAEELQWMGLDDWLKSQKGPVRKEQIDEFVKNNKVEIKEVYKAGEEQVHEDVLHDAALEAVDSEYSRALRDPTFARRYPHVDDFLETPRGQEIYNDVMTNQPEGSTKYSEYQLPGGENYRELLLTLPEKKVGPNNFEALQYPDGSWGLQLRGEPFGTIRYKSKREAMSEAKMLDKTSGGEMRGAGTYTTSHWDEPNVLAHVRVNDRQLGGKPSGRVPEVVEKDGAYYVKGKENEIGAFMTREGAEQEALSLQAQEGGARTLFLEEVQSDWHQAGRKQGYKVEGDEATLKVDLAKAMDELQAAQADGRRLLGVKGRIGPQETINYLREGHEDFGGRLGVKSSVTQEQALEAAKRIEAAQDKHLKAEQAYVRLSSGVPDAPFKTTWPDLVLKRMVREAAENGYDQIAWTPGEVQAARYDLSKHFDAIEVHKIGEGRFQISGRVPDPHRGSTSTWNTLVKSTTTDKLPDYVGKDLADKIAKQEDQVKEYHGLDLKVGGEGMRAFYDKILVDKANALGKKFGAKVEKQATPEQYDIIDVGRGGVDGTRTVYMVVQHGSDNPAKEFATRAEAEKWVKDNAPTVWVMKITPKMREAAVGKGFPLFSAGLPFQFERVDHDPFATSYQSPLFRTEPVDHDPFGVLPYNPNRT